MQFSYKRLVYLSDTDAAGVAFFSSILAMCHEAYEMSLFDYGIKLNQFINNSTIAIPIVHSSIDFLHPIFCSDLLQIKLTNKIIQDTEFGIDYQICYASMHKLQTTKPLALAKTRHVCIDKTTKIRVKFPEEIWRWLQ